jgi:hypothetical protein
MRQEIGPSFRRVHTKGLAASREALNAAPPALRLKNNTVPVALVIRCIWSSTRECFVFNAFAGINISVMVVTATRLPDQVVFPGENDAREA